SGLSRFFALCPASRPMHGRDAICPNIGASAVLFAWRTLLRPSNAICQLPAEPGPCFAYMPSYFYNSATKRCEKFIYGGCQGNGNRFPNMDECLKTCGSSGKTAKETQLVGS
uniref:BPTI/Kunitz inhibitor domain-containing protein n=1 Tax=Chelydra serpentina TaxID=8475 RepID=A0A8C3XPQ2_CHESE